MITLTLHQVITKCRRAGMLLAAITAGIIVAAAAPGMAIAETAAGSARQQIFTEASQEFGVPQEVLLAISFNQSRFENHKGQPSASGGYGLMHLTEAPQIIDGRGKIDQLPERTSVNGAKETLSRAAQLINTPAETVKADDKANVRAAAAMLADLAKQSNDGALPQGIEGWYAAVAALNSTANSNGQEFADNVYATIKDGASLTTTDKQTVRIEPKQVGNPDASKLEKLGLQNEARTLAAPNEQAECPATLSCKFVPARFAQNSSDPLDYGNYDTADRPKDMKIKYIVIHDTEGSYQSAIDWFRDPRSYVAAHYVIRSSDGEVTQMVKNKNVGWHAGNWYVNMHSIGIEHEGWEAEGASWYTEAMYRSSASLVRYLAKKYDIPLDREHIIGHDQFHALRPDRVAGMHTDPGPYWDWDHYMNLLGQPTKPQAGPISKLVTIAPRFDRNKPEVTKCENNTCTPLPEQSANFVYLRAEPRDDAPLLSDAGLHPDGAAGTADISDWSAKAVHGQHFAVAERRGDWTAIWFGGQKGWFYNPLRSQQNRTALPFDGRLVTPKPGQSEIPVYGRPLPEASAYKNGVPQQPLTALQYKIKAGQTYYAYDKKAPNDYLHVLAFDRSTPGDGERIVGEDTYIPISYNHRQAYVKASDVRVVNR